MHIFRFYAGEILQIKYYIFFVEIILHFWTTFTIFHAISSKVYFVNIVYTILCIIFLVFFVILFIRDHFIFDLYIYTRGC